MDETTPKTAPVDPPRGFHQGRVDEKGRLKLPAVFQEYLAKSGVDSLFITTMDRSTTKLYTKADWAANEAFFASPGEEAAEWADAVQFCANHYGADSSIDGQGRVLVPQELRRDLGIENQPVWLVNEKGVITVYGEQMYQQKLAAMKASLPTAFRELKKKSLVK
ncbi:MAG: hypothetical protein JSU00_22690 [Acidobacteria bacterium]|nr:hypothetical protein [Acidobacteriota bacterium]